ncbi:myb-like DNA-binding domain-containing protein [Colletotrichum karsti]|uniref:Myb-like DNA-binding domain-containing protein n=1 Tax=Colletotrichum karsti TaxID=1095194 RepID=A0A9P6LFR6_9PEZI|nr:myb-like DNA-binding domain-containing protein [Colletotrichum karsti]KAF9870855.1 myb-like DNA-binding domain-containing protein [Colletotrichum karsti]
MAQRRGPWSQQEDEYLMQLVSDQGPLNWVRIAQALGTRTPKQCRERFHQNLKPTLNHDPITAEEGAQIELLVLEIGKRWAEIARRLHGRSDNAVKNWWNGSQNRRKRHDRRRANQGSSGYDDRRYFSRPTLTLNPHASALPLPRHAISSPVSPTFYSHGHGLPYYHLESPLPSPCSTASPGSDALDGEASTVSDVCSSYTTSPQCLSRGTSPSLQLPPLRNVLDSSSQPRSLPSFGAILNVPADRKEHTRLPSMGSHLLTAPNSPVSSNVPSPSADKDSRMDVSALLG